MADYTPSTYTSKSEITISIPSSAELGTYSVVVSGSSAQSDPVYLTVTSATSSYIPDYILTPVYTSTKQTIVTAPASAVGDYYLRYTNSTSSTDTLIQLLSGGNLPPDPDNIDITPIEYNLVTDGFGKQYFSMVPRYAAIGEFDLRVHNASGYANTSLWVIDSAGRVTTSGINVTPETFGLSATPEIITSASSAVPSSYGYNNFLFSVPSSAEPGNYQVNISNYSGLTSAALTLNSPNFNLDLSTIDIIGLDGYTITNTNLIASDTIIEVDTKQVSTITTMSISANPTISPMNLVSPSTSTIFGSNISIDTPIIEVSNPLISTNMTSGNNYAASTLYLELTPYFGVLRTTSNIDTNLLDILIDSNSVFATGDSNYTDNNTNIEVSTNSSDINTGVGESPSKISIALESLQQSLKTDSNLSQSNIGTEIEPKETTQLVINKFMPNGYFNYNSLCKDSEKKLYNRNLTEMYKKFGVAAKYYTTSYSTNNEKVFGEDNNRKVLQSYDVKLYYDLPPEARKYSRYGLENMDNFIMYLSKMDFNTIIPNYRPQSGDLIYVPYNTTTYEITFANDTEEQFLNTQHTWKLYVRVYVDNRISLTSATSSTPLSAVVDQTDVMRQNIVVDEEKSAILYDSVPGTSASYSSASNQLTRQEIDLNITKDNPKNPFGTWW